MESDDSIRSGKLLNCYGYICEVAKLIAKQANFKFSMKTRRPGKIISNSDFYWLSEPTVAIYESNDVFASQVFTTSDDLMAIPPPEAFDAYEKLLLPFDEATWFWIVMTFSFIFGAIFTLKFTKPSIRQFVIGRTVKTPVLNVTRAFLESLKFKRLDEISQDLY